MSHTTPPRGKDRNALERPRDRSLRIFIGPPNAGPQLLGAAGARHERTLFPVSWTPLLDAVSVLLSMTADGVPVVLKQKTTIRYNSLSLHGLATVPRPKQPRRRPVSMH